MLAIHVYSLALSQIAPVADKARDHGSEILGKWPDTDQRRAIGHVTGRAGAVTA